jgi:hypothetical protein
VPTYLSETGAEVGDRGPANAVNAFMLIAGGTVFVLGIMLSVLTLQFPLPTGSTMALPKCKTKVSGTFTLISRFSDQLVVSWRIPIGFQCIFALTAGIAMFFLPDTPRVSNILRGLPKNGDAQLMTDL